jgi:hypothetical protein
MAHFTVNTTDDTVGEGGGVVSLRDALIAASANPGPDLIDFDPTVFSSGGTLTLTQGELTIAGDVTIDGDVNGDGKADITIDANHASRVIDVTAGDVAIDSLTLTGGYSTDGGAGVFVAAGASAEILDTTITGNVTNGSSNARGGGIRNEGTTTLIDSTVSNNYGSNAGGIFNPGGTLNLVNTTVSGNISNIYVGGIYSFNGHLDIADSTITGNYGGPSLGAGIESTDDIGTLSNSIVAGNHSGTGVADLFSASAFTGHQLTFAGVNVFSQAGGGGAGDIHLADLTKIFATVTTVDPDNNPGTNNSFQAGLLADNGGPVQTVAISPVGVASNAGVAADLPADTYDLNGNGNTAEPLPVDARGEPRVFDGALDVGAMEVQGGQTFVVTTLDDELDSTDPNATLADFGGAGDLSLREALVLASRDTGDTISFDPSLAGGTLTLTQGELAIASDVTIDGDVNGDGKADITIDANHASRVIDVTAGDVVIDSLTLTGGYSTDGGAGVFVAAGASAEILDSTITGNVTQGSSNARGGGIRNEGTTTLIDSTVSNNYGSNAGGIYNPGGTLSLLNTTVSGNISDIYVGGIYGKFGHLDIADSTITGNYGGVSLGAGIESTDDIGALSNSIVAGNQNNNGIADLFSEAVFTSNQLSFAGVNVFSQAGGGGAGDIHQADLTKIFATVTTVDPDNNPATNNSFQAGLLADNGGPVQTVAINPTGVAVDAGDTGALPPDTYDLNSNRNTAEPLPVDARGQPRVSGASVDVGAFEAPGVPTPTNLVVTTLDDESYEGGDVDSETADGTGLSLREAIGLADTAGGSHTITFDPSLTGGTLTLTQGALTIDSNLTIEGDIGGDGNRDVTISGGNASRVFTVAGPTITVGFEGLVVADGNASGAGAAGYGGGVYVATGDALTLTNTAFTNNYASRGGAIFAGDNSAVTLGTTLLVNNSADASGGAIDVGDHAAITLAASTVAGNEANGQGGGIYGSTSATIALVGSQVIYNDAADGGGIYAGANAAVTLTGSTLLYNSADRGGGVYAAAGAALTLTNTTLAGNIATADGGAIDAAGAIALTNSTLTGNYAGGAGGGIYNSGAGGTTLTNSIVAGNAAAGAGQDLYGQGGSPLTFAGGNILGSTPSNFTAVTGSYTTVDGTDQTALGSVFATVGYSPLSGVLSGIAGANGGSVATVAINPTGIAQDAGVTADAVYDDDGNPATPPVPIPTDARGFARVAGASVDVGAFEQQAGATFVITTLDDELDSTDPNATLADFGGAGDLSLREALVLAAEDPTSIDTITFDPSLIGGSTPGVDDGVLTLTRGELPIASNVVIDGDVDGNDAPDITIDASGASRAFDVYGGTSTLNGLVLTDGYGSNGGAIAIGDYGFGNAHVTLSNSTVTNSYSGYGGGISIDPGSSLTLIDSTVSNNQAGVLGGGIANAGTLTVMNSTIAGNHANPLGNSRGGAIYNGGTLTLIDSTVSDNFAGSGGGVYNAAAPCGCSGPDAGPVTILNTTLSGNRALYGGGIANEGGTLSLVNATLYGNAADRGGGLISNQGTLDIASSTVTGNFAYQFGGIGSNDLSATLTNSIVAGNSASGAASDVYLYSAPTYSGVNVFSQGGVGRPGTDIYAPDVGTVFASLTTVDPDGVPASGDEFQAGALANNGGPVATVAILPGGVAQDTGIAADLPPDTFDIDGNSDTAEPLPIDAHGQPRVYGGALDVGAYEAQDEPPVVTTSGGTTRAVALAPVVVDAGVTVGDVDNPTLASGTVSITGNFQSGEDVLAFTNDDAAAFGNIGAVYSNGVLTLTSVGQSATLAQWQAAFAAVTYEDTSATPNTSPRTVSFVVNDGTADSAAGTQLVDVDNAPALSGAFPATIAYVDHQTVPLASGISVTDADDTTAASAVVQVTGGFAGDGDVLSVAGAVGSTVMVNGHTYTVSYSGSGTTETLTISGAGPLADYAQLLDAVRFQSDATDTAHLSRTVTWSVDDPLGVASNAETQTLAITLPRLDYDGDGISDVLFRDAAGDFGYDRLDSRGGSTWVPLGGSSPAYDVVGSGDFNGDGRADVLFRDSATGDYGYDAMNAGGTSTTWVPLGGSSPAYSVAGVGDFNGDGRDDILFRDDSNGDFGYEAMNAGGTSDTWLPRGASSPASSVAGVGDFNGDGRDDVLFRDTSTGDFGYDAMSPGGASATWTPVGGSAPAYNVVGVGYFNNDGLADVLFRDNATGDFGYDDISSGTPVWNRFGPSDHTYPVVGIGDDNGNGVSDVLFRNSTTGDIGYDSVSLDGSFSWVRLAASSTAYHVVGA